MNAYQRRVRARRSLRKVRHLPPLERAMTRFSVSFRRHHPFWHGGES